MNIPNIGGQAVIEGIMLRSPNYCAVAIRKDGEIKSKIEKASPLRFSNVPILRGIVGLYDILILGTKCLLWSASQAEGGEEMTKKDMVFLLMSSIAMALFFFMIIPFFGAKLIYSDGVGFNIIDGLFRILIFTLYIIIISRMEDVRILFMYHGAEHKVVNYYEQKREEDKNFSLENALPYSTAHPRCGTTFVLFVLIISIIVFSIFTADHWTMKLALRLVLLPLIVGISYEGIKYAGKYQNYAIMRALVAPGLLFQKLTTREPTKDQLEVALTALKLLIEKESHGKSA